MNKKSDKIAFTKMSGTGNDFIVIDNRQRHFSGEEEHLFHRLCQRRTSIGADGLILVEEGEKAPVRMRYFNADGRESTMCGNGARCTARFAFEKKIVNQNTFSLEAPDGLHAVRIGGDAVHIGMTPPGNPRTGWNILRENEFTEGGSIDTGVPHYVIFVDDLDTVDVESIGGYYRHHSAFPDGTNVNFVRIEKDRINVRTYERGVERETLSCGTGCVASALIASRVHGRGSPITVRTRGGTLRVNFDDAWKSVGLEGAADIVYEGVFQIPPDRE